MYRRADVVDESRQGEFSGAGTAADRVLGLQYGYGAPVAGQFHGSTQAVWSGAHHHRVVHPVVRSSAHTLDLTLRSMLRTFVVLRPGEMSGYRQRFREQLRVLFPLP